MTGDVSDTATPHGESRRYRALGAAVTGTLVYASFGIAAYAVAYQINIFALAVVVAAAVAEIRLEFLHSHVEKHIQPVVNQLWGVESASRGGA